MDVSTASSCTSTSSIQHINSQLIAHGFTTNPGLSLDGVSNEGLDRVAKCLLAMLSQRVTDMSRAEDLSTKLRTLSYDHERLMGMHRASTEQALTAEREVNMYKSRLAAATRSLQSSESSHRQTNIELQRTRTSLQALRAAHAAELKKREKEIERMVDKWTKLADSQTKSTPGMVFRGANADIVSGMELLGKGKGYLETALDHAETSRKELLDETTRLRRLILVSANRLQSMLHEIRILASIKSEEPIPFDHDALFPLTPINAADDKILSLFASANDAISVLSRHLSDNPNATHASQASEDVSRECTRLQTVIEKLQSELDEAKKLHETHEIETRELLDQIAAQGMQRAPIDDMVIASERDAERDRLDRIRKELEDERDKFTQAAVKLGKEKSAFESERIQFLEERRSWQVQQMLSEHPHANTPEAPPPGVPPSPSLAAHLPEVKKSPRKTPRKQKVVGKSGNNRKTRVSRRSSIFSILPPTHVEPAYETEVIPIVVPASKPQTNNKSAALTKSILPTSFVLPPPSPRTSLPPPDALLGPSDPCSPDVPQEHAPVIPTIIEPAPDMSTNPPGPVPPVTPPVRRTFPMAKPLAPHMTHAYSPIKPSPLSRILMLADSPESPEAEPMPKLRLVGDDAPSGPVPVPARDHDGSDDESPLREKKTERNVARAQAHAKKEKERERGNADARKRTRSRERSAKVRNDPEPCNVVTLTAKPKATVGAGEKENREKPTRRASPVPTTATSSKPVPNYASTNKPTEGPTKAVTKPPAKFPVGKGGARRVPIGSAEAAPLPGWRG